VQASLLSLPPIQLFSPGGPLSLAAVAELDAAAEAAAEAGGQLGGQAGKPVSGGLLANAGILF
jgi:hypothetical protein